MHRKKYRVFKLKASFIEVLSVDSSELLLSFFTPHRERKNCFNPIKFLLSDKQKLLSTAVYQPAEKISGKIILKKHKLVYYAIFPKASLPVLKFKSY